MADTNQQVLSEISRTETYEAAKPENPGEGVRLYQGRILDELPGAAFVAITLVWIFSSFGKLIW